MVIGEVGTGDVFLALVPTFNLMVLAVVWKTTGKTRDQLTGEIHEAKSELQDDLENGLKSTVESNSESLREMKDQVREIRTDVAHIHDHLEKEGLE